MHFPQAPRPSLHDEEVVGAENVEVGQDAGHWFQDVPRISEINEVVNKPILSQEEVCEPPHRLR